jgi:hypothetical protein
MTKWSTYRLKDQRKQPDSENLEASSIPGLNNNIGTQIDQSNHNLNRAPVAHVEIKKLENLGRNTTDDSNNMVLGSERRR